MTGELHTQPLQDPKIGPQFLSVLLMESILTDEERGLGWTGLGLQPNEILIGLVHTRHLVPEGLPVGVGLGETPGRTGRPLQRHSLLSQGEAVRPHRVQAPQFRADLGVGGRSRRGRRQRLRRHS
jgi:hypothetical protein